MIRFEFLDPRMTYEHLGLIPFFLDVNDPRPAKEQIHHNYAHGGGWRPFDKFRVSQGRLLYPGDPPMKALARAKLRDELVVYYDCSWVAIFQPDGSYEVARVD